MLFQGFKSALLYSCKMIDFMCLNMFTWETNYPYTEITLNRNELRGFEPLCGISLRFACTKEYELAEYELADTFY